MRVFSLDFDCCEPGIDVTVFDLDNSNDCGCDVVIYIPGPPGPAGPPGTGDEVEVVTASGNIPMNQTYTVVQGTAPTIQTLPPLSGFTFPTTLVFTIANVTSHLVQIEPSGSDQILVGEPVNEPFINTSFSFLATPIGWVII
jgi:hypothetical protein